MIVDINEYELLVERGEDEEIAQFVSHILIGGVGAVEKCDGEVVAFMGDAFLAILPTPQSCGEACFWIANDVKTNYEYFESCRRDDPEAWPFFTDIGMKIAIESGNMDISSIESRFLGSQVLLAGNCINYAARIAEAGKGNRCHLGPKVASEWPYSGLSRRRKMTGKHSGKTYPYYAWDLSEYWEPD